MSKLLKKEGKKVYYLTENGKKRVSEISKIKSEVFEKMISEILMNKIICGWDFSEIIEKLGEFKDAEE